jgi:RNA polymerase sigma factor (TIGR02999 family)
LSHEQITSLLAAWSAGDASALDSLMPLVYDELLRMAHAHLRRERPEHTLQRTGLVHEAFLKLIDQRRVQWQNREHFLGLASRIMRRILVDHARNRLAAKRGAGAPLQSLDETGQSLAPFGDMAGVEPVDALSVSAESVVDLISVDRALAQLEQLDPQQGRIVELRFFGGLTIEETAAALSISEATVKRDWAMARAWLHVQLSAGYTS